jgi:Flp pilus assembly protein TadG
MDAKRGKRTGAAVAELAIWLPFLVFLFAIGVDWCRSFVIGQVLQQAAENAASIASGIVPSNGDDKDGDAKKAAVEEGSKLNPPLEAAAVTIARTGGTTTVTIEYEFTPIVLYAKGTLVRTAIFPNAMSVGD